MIASSFVELVGRMLVSLACVLALIGVAYIGVRRSTLGKGVSSRSSRSGAQQEGGSRSLSLRRIATGRRPAAPPVYGMRLLSRVGLTRSSSLVAVQFGENVFLVAGSETAPATVLAQVPVEAWQPPVAVNAIEAKRASSAGLNAPAAAAAPFVASSFATPDAPLEATASSDVPAPCPTSDIDATVLAPAPRRSWLDAAREATVRQP